MTLFLMFLTSVLFLTVSDMARASASPQCAHVIKLIIHVYITMHKQKTPIYKLSSSKETKNGTFRLKALPHDCDMPRKMQEFL